MEGLAQVLQVGASAGASFVEGKKNREAVQRKAAEDKLARQTTEAKIDQGIPQQEAEKAQQANEDILNRFALDDTSTAFKKYTQDFGNPNRFRHLKQVLKNNPRVQQIFGAMDVSALDITNDRALIQQHGLDIEDFTGPLAANYQQRFIKSHNLDGSYSIADVYAEMQAGGHLNRMTAEEYDQAKKRFDLTPKGGDTAFNRNARLMAKARGISMDEQLSRMADTQESGVVVGKQNMAEKSEQEYIDSGFLNTPFNELSMAEQMRASQIVRRIEQTGGKKLTNAAKDDLRQIKKLVQLGEQFTDNMSPEATGAFDRLVGGVSKYTSLVPEEQKHMAQNAYLSYRNVMLKYMSGAAVTVPEANRFREAFGSLNQRYPAVITQFKASLVALQEDLMSVTSTESPIMAHFYAGTSMDTLNDAIYDINEQLEFINNLPPGKQTEVEIQKGIDNLQGRTPALPAETRTAVGNAPTVVPTSSVNAMRDMLLEKIRAKEAQQENVQ